MGIWNLIGGFYLADSGEHMKKTFLMEWFAKHFDDDVVVCKGIVWAQLGYKLTPGSEAPCLKYQFLGNSNNGR